MNVCNDLAILDPNSFEDIEKNLKIATLNNLSAKILKHDSTATPSELKSELISFAKNWSKFKTSIEEEYTVTIAKDDNSNICKSCKNCAICVYRVLLKYNLFSSTYPKLSFAYNYLLTLPISQVAFERSFSNLKYIKNRLRNTLSEQHLEVFMLMNTEKSVLGEINNDEIINSLALSSQLLKKSMIL